MKSQVLAYYHMPYLSVFGMMLFLAVFTGMLLWVFQPWRRPVYEHISQLPLREDS